MTTYAQSTIHSKIAKIQKNNDKSLGRVLRGGSFCQPTNFNETLKNGRKHSRDEHLEKEIKKQLEILPKTRTNINRKMKNKVIPSLTKGDEIILMESSVFPPIYFKKTSMRNVLKHFKFPDNVKALPPNDDRTPLIFQIISNLFNEITFYIFNILIGENMITQNSETIPFTKCCNAPVYIQLLNNGSGKVLCNSASCPHSNIAQFLINFEDGKKLWKNITYFSEASQKDKILRLKISRLISNGKYKKLSLVDTVQQTSKQIVQLFYNTKNASQEPQVQFDDTPFLTVGPNVSKGQPQQQNENEQQIYEDNKPLTAEELLDTNDSDVDILKMKIHYLTRNQKNLPKKLSQDLVSKGKVFQSDFEMIKKIDEIMLQKRNTRNTRISFPKIMDQYRHTKYRLSKAKSLYSQHQKPLNNTFV